MARAIIVLFLAGCRQLIGIDDPAVAATDAAPPPIDAVFDAPDDASRVTVESGSCVTFSTQLDTCIVSFGGAITIDGISTYNTTTGVLTTPTGSVMPPHLVVNGPAGPIDVLLVTAFSLPAGTNLRATGSRPFGVVASGAITIEGTIDITTLGAGTLSETACGTRHGRTGSGDTGGGAGGGGGGFQGAGAKGGNGDADGGQSTGGGPGTSTERPLGPIGGCSGGFGGAGVNLGGDGGAGGGAILLASGTKITVSGAINAGGEKGRGGMVGAGGGGGGGSGGMIVLEAAIVTVSGTLAANGGGGGEGGDATTAGNDGETGLASSTAAAGGADATTTGANGASGSSGAQLFGNTPIQILANGGGGGGGGAGYIAIGSPTLSVTGVTSPPVQAWP